MTERQRVREIKGKNIKEVYCTRSLCGRGTTRRGRRTGSQSWRVSFFPPDEPIPYIYIFECVLFSSLKGEKLCTGMRHETCRLCAARETRILLFYSASICGLDYCEMYERAGPRATRERSDGIRRGGVVGW